jgi:hypothetical protein
MHTMTLSKIFHQVWYQGEANIPEKYKAFRRTFELMNPGWELLLHDNNSLRECAAKFSPQALELYDSFDIMHQKIDFGRMCAIAIYGGVTVDMDECAHSPVDELLARSPHCFEVAITLTQRYGRVAEFIRAPSMIEKALYNNANIIVPLGPDKKCGELWTAILGEIMRCSIEKMNSVKYKELSDFQKIQQTTGPVAFSNAVTKSLTTRQTKALWVVPENSLEQMAFSINNEGTLDVPKGSNSCFLHNTDGTWVDGSVGIFVKMLQNRKYCHMKKYLYLASQILDFVVIVLCIVAIMFAIVAVMNFRKSRVFSFNTSVLPSFPKYRSQ